MSALALSPHRLRQLDAMGVVAYRLRSRGTPAPPAAALPEGDAVAAGDASGVRIAVICESAAGASAKLLAAALGVPENALHWQAPRDGRLPDLDQNAAAFLVLGQPLARVLGAQLPTAAQQAATIIVTAAPEEWRGNALAKRLLWQALRPLRRHLRGQSW
ncbi:MAG TPA: hypothetical protein VLF18_12180 [Tahibacter sp.]|uniref:hypothetical protein n=1 Tax=Tahibacter sp. TaxID=2056211 RepID=UPI002CEAAE2C|nr:hypothetical protein [Tahibacter sp.]HSX60951.1 hypothetical protein [Tahibacter sp.]